MYPYVLNRRNQEAQSRIVKASRKLAASHELSIDLIAGLSVTDRKPELQALKRVEAVAALLEALVAGTGVGTDERPSGEEPVLSPSHLVEFTVGEIRDFMAYVDGVEFLKEALKHERANRDRKSAVEALEARLKELGA